MFPLSILFCEERQREKKRDDGGIEGGGNKEVKKRGKERGREWKGVIYLDGHIEDVVCFNIEITEGGVGRDKDNIV